MTEPKITQSRRVRCRQVEPRSTGPSAPEDSSVGQTTISHGSVNDTISLDETDRHRRRLALRSDKGIEFVLELETTMLLRDGDVLRLEDGRGIRVVALPEPLYEVRGRDRDHLLHLTWHVGNRHLATQIMQDHIRIRRDPVIRHMLEELGADVNEVSAGFDPVGGAYDGQAAHGHEHGRHGHGHEHEHAHEHGSARPEDPDTVDHAHPHAR